jgi:ABC-2 type transport system permease protein
LRLPSLPAESWLLARRRISQTLREPRWIVAGLPTPILYLVLFAPLLTSLPASVLGAAGGVVQMFLPGMLVLFAFGSGTGIGWTIIDELNTGVIERFRVSPVRRVSLLLASVVKDALMFLVSAILVVLVALPFGFRPNVAGLALCLLLLAMLTGMVSAWSAGLGLTFRSIGGLAAVVTGLQLPLTLLSGALLPMSLGPVWLRVLAHVNPLYYAVLAARDLVDGQLGTLDVGLGFAVTAVLLGLTMAWATRVFHRVVA